MMNMLVQKNQKLLPNKFFYVFILTFLLSLSSTVHALDTLIETKAALFCPTDRKFQKIYESVGGIYGGEATCHISHNFYGWGSVDYFSKEGKSIGGHDSTKITIVPLGLGIKYFYPVNCVDFYAGGGFLCTYLHMHDRSPDVIKHISKWGSGGTAKVGAIYNINPNLFLDLFANYSYMKIDFHRTNHGEVIRNEANLCGFSIGLGIGYRFGCCCK